MTLKNMTQREVKFWAKGCQDTLRAIEKNGLWRCPLCMALMAHRPVAYNICQTCGKEFGVDASSYSHTFPVWR